MAIDPVVAVIGLGYVGLPLACRLASVYQVIGFDRNPERLAELRTGLDRRGEVSSAVLADVLADVLANNNSAETGRLRLTDDAAQLRGAEIMILCVPTPIDADRRPDLALLRAAATTAGGYLAAGGIVVVESTVYPGCTESVVVPAVAAASGLQPGVGFTWGYSPERINPGDREHGIDAIIKVVAGSDQPTTDRLASLYGAVIPAGVHVASSVAVAECAKVIENSQRDVNIALMNELALICHRLGIATSEVLAAAQTKWNFLPFHAGLVGGHCIGVDPYYLSHAAAQAGYQPEVILAGRRINDGMGAWVASECVRLLIDAEVAVKGARVLVIGATFKPDVRDVRNSGARTVVAELHRFGCSVALADPIADGAECQTEIGADLTPWPPARPADYAALICLVGHAAVHTWAAERPRLPAIVCDLTGCVADASWRL